MKTCCLTGATGCVGRNLVEVLVENNWDIVVLHRRSSDLSRLKGCKVRFQEVDLHDLPNVKASIPTNLDAVFHVAGNTSHWAADENEQWKDNVLATRNLICSALEKKVGRFIFTSTGATRFYQETDAVQATQLDPPYVRTKRLAELEVYDGMRKGLDAIILHPIIVVGAYDYNSYVQIFEDVRSRYFKIAFPGKISFCHARDIAMAHLRAYERGRRGERYVLGGIHTTWHELFCEVAKVMGIRSTIHVVPSALLKFVSYASAVAAYVTGQRPVLTPQLVKLVRHEPDISYYDKNKAQEHLGYHSCSLEVMVRDCYQWLVSEGRLSPSTPTTSEIV